MTSEDFYYPAPEDSSALSIDHQPQATGPDRPARPAGHEDTGGPVRPASILDKIRQKLPQVADREEAVARKHVCSGVWCKSCYKRYHLERHYKRLLEMPWEESRLVTLTLDRNLAGSGADAYLFIREKKALGRFFVKLRRRDVVVQDWAGQMEFHRDGTPHYHILIRTQAGPRGMIGGDALRLAWPWGRVHEDYFKDQAHYHNTVGYFGKAGYFHKGKQYQTELPDYFQSEYFKGKRIMRFYSARRPSGEQREPVQKNPVPKKSETISARKLSVCGQFTHIYAQYEDRAGFLRSQPHYLMTINLPYREFKARYPGYYQEGVGYNFYLSGAPPEERPCPY